MRKITVWICLLSLGTSASAQTQTSILSEYRTLQNRAFDTYIEVSETNFRGNVTSSECTSLKADVISEGDALRAYIEKPYFKSYTDGATFDIKRSAAAVFSAVVSTLSAVNLMCSNTSNKYDTARLYLNIADLKFDIADLYLDKASR